MTKGQKRVLQMLRKVLDFLEGLIMPNPPKSYVEQRKILDDVVTRLEAHAVRQDLGGRRNRGDTRRGRSLRRVLMAKHMRPIARIAAAQQVAGFEKELSMPAERVDRAGLVTAARAMQQAAAQHKQVFLDCGRPEDFLERMQETVDAITATIDVRQQRVIDVRGATAGIRQDIATGRQAVKQLHAIVVPRVEDNHDELERWKAARRIGGWPTDDKPAGPASQAA